MTPKAWCGIGTLFSLLMVVVYQDKAMQAAMASIGALAICWIVDFAMKNWGR